MPVRKAMGYACALPILRDRQLIPRYPPIRLEIPLAGRIHHAVGQRRGRGVAVPAAGLSLGVEIVAQWLLVEGRLRPAGLVDIGGPEPRTVRRYHLVDQDDAAVGRAAEFEFGVGDDDALMAGDPLAEIIDRARHALEFFGDVAPENLADAGDRDVLVMAGFGLGGRAEDRCVKLLAFGEAVLQLLAGERAGCGIFLP